MAYAWAMEVEAAERYAELADQMDTHHNREVSELFAKLSRIEGKHRDQIMAKMGWVRAPDTRTFRWETPEGPETTDYSDLHYLMQPYHALKLASTTSGARQNSSSTLPPRSCRPTCAPPRPGWPRRSASTCGSSRSGWPAIQSRSLAGTRIRIRRQWRTDVGRHDEGRHRLGLRRCAGRRTGSTTSISMNSARSPGTCRAEHHQEHEAEGQRERDGVLQQSARRRLRRPVRPGPETVHEGTLDGGRSSGASNIASLAEPPAASVTAVRTRSVLRAFALRECSFICPRTAANRPVPPVIASTESPASRRALHRDLAVLERHRPDALPCLADDGANAVALVGPDPGLVRLVEHRVGECQDVTRGVALGAQVGDCIGISALDHADDLARHGVPRRKHSASTIVLPYVVVMEPLIDVCPCVPAPDEARRRRTFYHRLAAARGDGSGVPAGVAPARAFGNYLNTNHLHLDLGPLGFRLRSRTMYVCVCHGISEKRLDQAIARVRARSSSCSIAPASLPAAARASPAPAAARRADACIRPADTSGFLS